MDLQEVGWRGVGWIAVAQYMDRWRVLVNAVMNLWFPQNAGNFFNSLGLVSFSQRTLFLVVS